MSQQRFTRPAGFDPTSLIDQQSLVLGALRDAARRWYNGPGHRCPFRVPVQAVMERSVMMIGFSKAVRMRWEGQAIGVGHMLAVLMGAEENTPGDYTRALASVINLDEATACRQAVLLAGDILGSDSATFVALKEQEVVQTIDDFDALVKTQRSVLAR